VPNLGFPELILIFIIALLVFGPKKLPELGKSLGKGLKEFKKASEELKSNWDEHLKDVEKSVDDVKKDVEKHVSDVKASVTDATKDIEAEIYKDYPSTSPAPAAGSETPKSESKEEVHQS
jgi:sec-independent protein translocase protein TatA